MQETHAPYTAAVIQAGKEKNVSVIDLDSLSRDLLDQLGPKFAGQLFMQLDSLEHPNYPAGVKDNTHFNDYGARRMAELVLAAIRRTLPDLAEHIIKPILKK